MTNSAADFFNRVVEILRGSKFDHLSLIQSQKQDSVNIEYQLKSELARPVCMQSMKIKMLKLK